MAVTFTDSFSQFGFQLTGIRPLPSSIRNTVLFMANLAATSLDYAEGGGSAGVTSGRNRPSQHAQAKPVFLRLGTRPEMPSLSPSGAGGVR
ncbi:hypothetical protein QBD00_004848 [Ochrobactrum sp. AN78]|nr:hypothetical protein [Ochrobactrum sp. AN78]